MQSLTELHEVLSSAARDQEAVRLYTEPTGHYQGGISVDDGRYKVVGYRLNGGARQPGNLEIDGWLSPFWRVVEQDGWQVAHKNRSGKGQFVWTLEPVHECKVQGVPTTSDLLEFVEKVRPLAGDRAQRALDIAVSGKIAQLPVDDSGNDQWQVKGSRGEEYTVSIHGKTCTCPDAENGAPRWMDGPLCKHRLAVMYIVRWQEAVNARPEPHEVIAADSSPRPTAYVTVVAPTSMKQGWRWCIVRGFGMLTRYSMEEYPDSEHAMKAATVIANCEALPLVCPLTHRS